MAAPLEADDLVVAGDVDGLHRSHCRSGHPYLLARNDERAVVEDGTHLVGAAAPGAGGPREGDQEADEQHSGGDRDDPPHGSTSPAVQSPGGAGLVRAPPSRKGLLPPIGWVAPPGQRWKTL